MCPCSIWLPLKLRRELTAFGGSSSNKSSAFSYNWIFKNAWSKGWNMLLFKNNPETVYLQSDYKFSAIENQHKWRIAYWYCIYHANFRNISSDQQDILVANGKSWKHEFWMLSWKHNIIVLYPDTAENIQGSYMSWIQRNKRYSVTTSSSIRCKSSCSCFICWAFSVKAAFLLSIHDFRSIGLK